MDGDGYRGRSVQRCSSCSVCWPADFHLLCFTKDNCSVACTNIEPWRLQAHDSQGGMVFTAGMKR